MLNELPGHEEKEEKKSNRFKLYTRWCVPGEHWFKTTGHTGGGRVCEKHKKKRVWK